MTSSTFKNIISVQIIFFHRFNFIKIFFLFCNLDEKNSPTSMKVLDRLERIDGETDEMDIIFVKMGDPRYARKWGVTKLPAIVYFRNRFPSIYRGRYNKDNHFDSGFLYLQQKF